MDEIYCGTWTGSATETVTCEPGPITGTLVKLETTGSGGKLLIRNMVVKIVDEPATLLQASYY